VTAPDAGHPLGYEIYFVDGPARGRSMPASRAPWRLTWRLTWRHDAHGTTHAYQRLRHVRGVQY
jgi:hypothetical protein